MPAAALALAIATSGSAAAADPPLEYGMYPGNTFSVGKYAGEEGTPRKGQQDLTVPRLVELASGRPLQVHFYAQWNRGVPEATERQMDAVLAQGLKVNLALKYVPPAGRNGDIQGFAAWVGEVVAAHPRVSVWQITNEANVNLTPDSDGGSQDPRGALIEGVKAAGAVAGPEQKVGFNWFYRLDPASDSAFWLELGTRGGAAFRAALDYAGVDIYSGTYITPLYSVDDRADYERALRYLREELMPLAGLGSEVPIYIQETGYPTLDPALRSEERQARALADYIRATEGFNVGLLQWFQLTDAESRLGDGWGVLRPDYSRKPAFCVMRDATPERVPGRPCEGARPSAPKDPQARCVRRVERSGKRRRGRRSRPGGWRQLGRWAPRCGRRWKPAAAA